MEKSHITLNLARQDFRIVCAESPEYMKSLENAVNARIEAIKKKYPTMSTMRVVLLAMLDMEDDLFKMNIKYEEIVAASELPLPDEDIDF